MSNKNTAKAVEEAEKKAHEAWEKEYGQMVVIDPESGEISSAPKPEPKPDDAPPPGTPKEESKEEPVKEEEPVEIPPPPSTPEPPREDFEHKFSVLQGKYNAEVPALAYELAQANQKIKNLELLQKPKEEPAEPETPPSNIEDNPKMKAFKAEYPDVFEAATIIAKSIVESQMKPVQEKITKVEQTVGKVNEGIGQNAKEKFLGQLDGDAGVGKEWRTLNKDPEFISWLQNKDIYTGRTKHELLSAAWDRHDPDATLQFFKDFKTVKLPPKPPENKGKDVDPNRVDPPRGGSGGPKISSPGKDGPTVTTADLSKFYKDQVDGVYRGREADAEKEERRLLKAMGVIK